ncbi:MAG: proprotein convertase P-domain-containing protein [Candidatus Hydrogenedentes bacterium]|nr:proprotein convertase P-domain-containing protein [Candidatus Hydrogenedentota bacterium]
MSTRRLALGFAAMLAACLLTGCPKTTYWSHDAVPIPDNNIDDWAVSTIEVSRSFTITDLNVTVNVTHPDITDCDAWLVSPEGEIVPLIFLLSGADLVDTTFNDEASATIDSGTSPYTGHWLVDSFYVNAGMFMVDGEDAQGTWTLNFRDQQAENVGEITSWGLRFNSAN